MPALDARDRPYQSRPEVLLARRRVPPRIALANNAPMAPAGSAFVHDRRPIEMLRCAPASLQARTVHDVTVS